LLVAGPQVIAKGESNESGRTPKHAWQVDGQGVVGAGATPDRHRPSGAIRNGEEIGTVDSNKQVEWTEVRGQGNNPPEPFLVTAQWGPGGWQFWDRSLLDLAGIAYPAAGTPELVAGAEREWALRSTCPDEVGNHPVGQGAETFVALAVSQQDQRGSNQPRQNPSGAGRGESPSPAVLLGS
jgi:hypothetical protein